MGARVDGAVGAVADSGSVGADVDVDSAEVVRTARVEADGPLTESAAGAVVGAGVDVDMGMAEGAGADDRDLVPTMGVDDPDAVTTGASRCPYRSSYGLRRGVSGRRICPAGGCSKGVGNWSAVGVDMPSGVPRRGIETA